MAGLLREAKVAAPSVEQKRIDDRAHDPSPQIMSSRVARASTAIVLANPVRKSGIFIRIYQFLLFHF